MGGVASGLKNAASAVYNKVLKPVGSGILTGVKAVGNGILNVGNTVRSGIGKAMDFVNKVPIVGGLVNRALDSPILDGVSIRQAAGVADAALDTGNAARDAINAVSRGDLDGVIKAGEGAYNAGRGARDKFNDVRQKRQQILNGAVARQNLNAPD